MAISKKKLDVSVIIPTANRPKQIKTQLDSILKNSALPKEIIVIDQSKDNRTHQVVINLNRKKATRVIYLRNDKSGTTVSKNQGSQKATGKYLAFTDDDAWVHRNWLATGFRTMEANPKIGVLGGRIIAVFEPNPNEPIQIPDEYRYVLPQYDQGDLPGNFPANSSPPGVSLWIARTDFFDHGLFDERLGPNYGRIIQIYGEEFELAARIRAKGKQIYYSPELIVYHPVPVSRQTFAFLRSRLKTEGLTSLILWRLTNPSFKILVLFFPRLGYSLIRFFLFGLTSLLFPKNILFKARMARVQGELLGLIHYNSLLNQGTPKQ